MLLGHNRKKQATAEHEPLELESGCGKEPIVQCQPMKILKPVPMIAQVVPFEPTRLRWFIVDFVLRFFPGSPVPAISG
jgi:hypothetical protein